MDTSITTNTLVWRKAIYWVWECRCSHRAESAKDPQMKGAAAFALTLKPMGLIRCSTSVSAPARWSMFTINASKTGLEARQSEKKLLTAFTIAMNLYSASYANMPSATKSSIKGVSIAFSTTNRYTLPSPNYSTILTTKFSRFWSAWNNLWVLRSVKGPRTTSAWTIPQLVASTVLFIMHLSAWCSTPRLLDMELQYSWTETSSYRGRDLCSY